jgi:hypothetical protein
MCDSQNDSWELPESVRIARAAEEDGIASAVTAAARAVREMKRLFTLSSNP